MRKNRLQSLLSITGLALLFSCNGKVDKEQVIAEIYSVESAFQQMLAEKGIMEAFYYFADENAVLKRENDSLIIGKEKIQNYYNTDSSDEISLTWKPDFVDVSASGDLAYTYGKYEYKRTNSEGETQISTGVFHSVWKRQKDGSWKYVWD